MEYIVQTTGLTKYYHKFCALNHVSIAVRRGEIYGLIGDNGAGKTTFLKLLAGQIFPDEGEMVLFGECEPKRINVCRMRMGTIIEGPGFYQGLSVEKNLEYFRIQKGIPGKQSVEEALELTGLTGARKKKAKTLSYGMKQRLGLAIAILGVPELLLLDEPINGLDPSGIIEIRKLLKRLSSEKGITIILSSHILSELEQTATVYGFLKDGILLEQVSAEELAEKCADYVEIQVSDPEMYVFLLEEKLHHREYRIVAGRGIHILNAGEEIEKYSWLASEAGLQVFGLTRNSQTLEEYYLKLKNGGK